MTQINFQIPPHAVPASREVHFPSRMDVVHGNQLQFNLQSPPKASNLETKFQKPRPIVIEKLLPPTSSSRGEVIKNSYNPGPSVPLTNLSSERLSLAIQLAKMDIKQLKRMSSASNTHLNYVKHDDMIDNVTEDKKSQKLQNATSKKSKSKQPTISDKVNYKNTAKSDQAKVGKTLLSRASGDKQEKVTEMKFYPEQVNENANPKSSGSIKEVSEITRLRKELQNYMKRLDKLIVHETSPDSNVKQKPSKILDDDEVARMNARAEEQASRSARMLYVLQRKVQEIQDELERQTGLTRHTKKTHTMNRLAAAHRSAVRALQMFVKHAPLYYDTQNQLPNSYLELANLIKQLSLLSSQMDVGDAAIDDIDLISKLQVPVVSTNKTKLLQAANVKAKGKPKEAFRSQGINKTRVKRGYQAPKIHRIMDTESLDKYMNWFQTRAADLGLPHSEEEVLTPERQQVLKAGLDAIERAKKESFIEEPRSIGNQRMLQQYETKRGTSVLYPNELKQRPIVKKQVRRNPPPRILQQNLKSHFTDATVASLLKAQDIKPYRPKKAVDLQERLIRPDSPLERSPGTPRKRDAELLKAQKGIDHGLRIQEGEVDIAEKEIRRQAWLDKEREEEIRRIQEIREQKEQELMEQKKINLRSNTVVKEAEGVIKTKLKPLLDKAEQLANEEKRREEEYKKSVKKRLAQIASDTVLSQAEILSEMILDDMILETVDELQRMEEENELETEVALHKTGAVVDNILERINKFEKEENDIRRRWTQLEYLDLGDLMSDVSTSYRTTEKKAYSVPVKPIQDYGSPYMEDVSLPLDVSARIFEGVRRYKKYSQESKLNGLTTGEFEKLSEKIMNDMLQDVANEVEGICDGYVDDIYQHEFVKDASLKSDSLR